MKKTNKFKLTYFEQDDLTLSVPELQRWTTLDVQLNSLFQIMGNGVISGWQLVSMDGLGISIAPGKGHVDFVATETRTTRNILGLTPNTDNYIFAQLEVDSYWTKNVNFYSRISKENTNDLYIGTVTTNESSVTNIKIDDRDVLGFTELIQNVVSEHRHLGGSLNPSRINLESEVTGTLNQANLPDLDAALIKSGVLDETVMPKIDHIEGLTNQGELTHSQIDSFISNLSLVDNDLLGEVATANLLQLTLALKHVYPDIDEYMVNQISYIPGISPDDYVDWENTTANVDTKTAIEGGTHKIKGTQVGDYKLKSKIWNSKYDFDNASLENTLVDNNRITLDTTENVLVVEDFTNVSGWNVVIEDLSTLNVQVSSDSNNFFDNGNSGKIVVNGEEVSVNLLTQKSFAAQDWSNYNFIKFYIYTESIEHGDIFFFLRDVQGGIQDSHTKVLSRNVASLDIETYSVGWQEVIIDISEYSRSAINRIGFYLSTQKGWDSSKSFEFNIDDILLSSGNKYKNSGSANFIYSNDFKLNFTDIKWDGFLPSDSQSTGVLIQTRYRVANDLSSLTSSLWSNYSALNSYALNESSKYKFIEIEVEFSSSNDFTRTPILRSLEVGFQVLSNELAFVYDDAQDWNKGSLFNLDASSGYLKISNMENLNSYLVAGQDSVSRFDSTFNELHSQLGLLIPRSTNEILNNKPAGFGFVSAIKEVEGNKFWISDIENNKVVKIDDYGNFYKGIYGSFLSDPFDNYGNEDNGPGTGIVKEFKKYSPIAKSDNVEVLHSIYNPELGILYVVFDQDLENIYGDESSLDLNKIYLKINSHVFRLNDSEVKLLGVDEEKYNIWKPFWDTVDQTSLKNIQQFKFNSHVLEINIRGGDRTALNRFVNSDVPKVFILSPKQNENLESLTLKIGHMNWNLSNGYNVYIDNVLEGTYYDNTVSISVSSGNHSLKVHLRNESGALEGNLEALAESEFWIDASGSSPLLEVNSPLPNQIVSSSVAYIDFSLYNFPILNGAQHIQYKLNDGPYEDYYSTSPILVSELKSGKNTVEFRTVDEFGISLNNEKTETKLTFISGNNSSAYVNLIIDDDAVNNYNHSSSNSAKFMRIDVGDIVFENIFSPIDLHVLNEDIVGQESDLLVGKLRSYSWLDGLGGSDRIEEILKGTQENQSDQVDIELDSELENIETENLIYKNKYLNGHSVVRYSVHGEVMQTNNSAIFAKSKEDAKNLLGSVNMIDSDEWMIGDSYNQRAIIVNPIKHAVEWEYFSDRYVVDFQPASNLENRIEIYDDKISNKNIYIKEGSNLIWQNKSSQPIFIYSGNTSFEDFQLNPNLEAHGKEFKSEILNPGETFSHVFSSLGEFNWFVYPDIFTGTINVTKFRILNSDNYYILESDGLESPFSSRIIKIDSSGSIEWTFGEGYMVKPRDIRPLSNNKLLIST